MSDTESQQHFTANNGQKQQRTSAECLFELFFGNERRHIIGTGPAVWEKDKNKWSVSVTTHDGPATLDHWQKHLDQKFILSIIPLLDNGKCLFACIDVDEYDLDYIDICDRIDRQKLPLIPCVSKSTGLHIFVFFKQPVPAELARPALRTWATQLRLTKFEIFPTSTGEDKLTRAVAMPYGATWNALPEQCALSSGGNALLLDNFLNTVKQITADDLPKPQKDLQQQQSSRKIPLYLQTAIDAVGPYPDNDRSPVIASIVWQLRELGFDADAIEAAVEHRGPFIRYDEDKGKSLRGDIGRIITKYDERHFNKKAKVEICTDIVPWIPHLRLPWNGQSLSSLWQAASQARLATPVHARAFFYGTWLSAECTVSHLLTVKCLNAAA